MHTSTKIAAIALGLRRRLSSRAAIIALLGAIAITAGVGAVGQNNGHGGWHHAMSATNDPQEVADHIRHMLQHVYIDVNATDAQKAQIEPIVQQAATDLMQLHAQFHAGHAQALALLTQDRIDRAALEALRVEHMRVADQASQRIVQLIADVADVLTPAQRKAFADHVAEHLASWHG